MCMFLCCKVPERTLKLTTIDQRRKVIAYFDSPRLAKVGVGLSKYDNGTYTKHLHKTNTFDGRNSIVLTVKPCLP